MRQVYIFTEDASSMTTASKLVMERVNAFLQQILSYASVEQILQSESQTCSTFDGQIDWSYSFSMTIVCDTSPKGCEQLKQFYS